MRTDNKLKVRQPLSRVDVILARRELQERVAVYKELLADELNVHEVRFLEEGQEAEELARTGKVELTVEGQSMVFPEEELEVLVEANPGYAAAGAGVGVVVLHTELTETLVDEGLVRELLARVQSARKDMDLGYTDRIHGLPARIRVERA